MVVPDKFLPDGSETFGIRDNQGFESLTSTPNRRYLYTAVENALVQDGPRSTFIEESPSRFLEYNLWNKRPGSEYIYRIDPIPFDPDTPGIFANNGLVDIQAIDNHGTFIAMERSFVQGVGNTIRLFETSTDGATDVSDYDSIMDVTYDPMSKERIYDFIDDVDPDNLEGMSFGPPLPDGRMLLIVVSDNNFNPSQTTQFIALAVELKHERKYRRLQRIWNNSRRNDWFLSLLSRNGWIQAEEVLDQSPEEIWSSVSTEVE